MNKINIRSTSLTFIVIFILGMTTFTNGVNAQTATDLAGTWSIDFQKMNTSANAVEGFDFNAKPAPSQARIKEAFESRTFTFNTDQTAVISFSLGGNSKQANGTWIYNDVNRLLTITVNGKSVEYQTALQGNTLTLTPLVLEAYAVFKSLSLTKN